MGRSLSLLLRVYEVVERTIIVVLLIVLMVIVLWSAGVLAVEFLGEIIGRFRGGPIDRTDMTSFLERFRLLHDVFGGFLLILIGVELMKTIVIYLSKHEMHVDVVFTVAIIAIARHSIDLDLAHLEAAQLVGMGVLVVALAIGYYFFRKAAALPGPRGDDAA